MFGTKIFFYKIRRKNNDFDWRIQYQFFSCIFKKYSISGYWWSRYISIQKISKINFHKLKYLFSSYISYVIVILPIKYYSWRKSVLFSQNYNFHNFHKEKRITFLIILEDYLNCIIFFSFSLKLISKEKAKDK